MSLIDNAEEEREVEEEGEEELRSPPSWEKLAAMAGEQESEDEDYSIHRDNSFGGMEVLANTTVNTSDILDMYLQSASRSATDLVREDGEDVFQDKEPVKDKDYMSIVRQRCLLKQPMPTRKCVVIQESHNVQKFVVNNIGEYDTELYEGTPRNNIDNDAFDGAPRLPDQGQRSRTPSDRDNESVYDTVSSTSSAAPLLRKITRSLPQESTTEPDGEAGVAKPLASSLESLGKILLSKTLEQVKKSLEDLSPSRDAGVLHTVMSGNNVHKVSRIYIKNLVVLSICFMILHTAFFSLRNLQSSINHEDGLGLAGLSCLSGSYIIFCIVAPSIVQKIRPKYALIISMVGHLLYELANFYPCFYTIIPASLLLGCAMSCLWVAQGTYITSIAVTYASVTGKKHQGIIGLFNGFFFFWLQLAQILGNLMSSFVFNMTRWKDLVIDSSRMIGELSQQVVTTEHNMNPTDKYSMGVDDQSYVLAVNTSTEGKSFCGAEYCHSYVIEQSRLFMEQSPLYILLGIFLSLTVLAMGLVAFFLDKLDVIFHKNKSSVKQQLVILGKLHQDHKVWLLCLMLIFVGMQQAHTFSEVTKAFVTCPLGVHMIGYVMVCFGTCDSLVSFLVGQLQRCCSAKLFMTIGAIVHLSLLAIMLLWQPEGDPKYMVFMLAGSLGAVDAIWQTQICNLVGFLYPKDREAAFASLRMYEGIGFTVAYACSQYLCMAIKTYILIGVLVAGMINYYAMEYIEHKRAAKMPSYPPVDV